MHTLYIDKNLVLFQYVIKFYCIYVSKRLKSECGSWPNNIPMTVLAKLKPECIARLSYHLLANQKLEHRDIQTILIEAAKLAPSWNPQLAEVHEKESAKGNANKATLAVARKLVAYMLAIDKTKKNFRIIEPKKAA